MRWLLRKLIIFVSGGLSLFTAFLVVFAVKCWENCCLNLDNYRPQIEHTLQQITGYPVTLDGCEWPFRGGLDSDGFD